MYASLTRLSGNVHNTCKKKDFLWATKKKFPYGDENKNIQPLYELLDNQHYKRFMESDEYRQVPFVHLAYFFQHFPKRLADPCVDGNILIKERLDNYEPHTQAAETLNHQRPKREDQEFVS